MAVLVLDYFWGVDLFGRRGKGSNSVSQSRVDSKQSDSTKNSLPTHEKTVPIAQHKVQEQSAPTIISKPAGAINKTGRVEPSKTATPVSAPSANPTIPKLKNPNDPLGTHGAAINVARMKPEPIEENLKLPADLRGGTRFVWVDVPTSVNIDLGKLELTVEQAGWVFLAADWNYEGNSGGDWAKERVNREQLVERGWQNVVHDGWLGTPEKPVELFKRYCKQGEVLAIRTNKYWPPAVFLPKAAGKPTEPTESTP